MIAPTHQRRHAVMRVRAKELGLVDDVVSPDALEDAVAGLRVKIIAAPAKAVVETKRLVRVKSTQYRRFAIQR